MGLVIMMASLIAANSSDEKGRPEVVIHADKTGAPISKYIYGQFIEHLGRCIYGGIWAEMLEDRKFFYPIGAKESPWMSTSNSGDVNCVEMVAEGAYVGAHSPKVTQSGMVTQRGLALREGKEYTGRIALAGDSTVEVAVSWSPPGRARHAGHPDLEVLEIEINPILSVPKLTPDYRTYRFRFRSDVNTDDADLTISGQGQGAFRIGAVSLMPADNVHGMRADTLALLKELDAPVYRWPGGNFVSGYNWKDGLGDLDRRPPRKNPAWEGIEHNDFGIDEFMTFCRELRTEPYIVVNSGLGDVRLAAEEVEYANGGADTPMGRLRAENGHRKPYDVRWWGIGNEMYGDWQLGHMPIEDYVRKHNEFAEAMRAVDPDIKLVAVGATGPWSEAMLTHCAEHMDALSEHFYCGSVPELLAHVNQIPNNVNQKVQAHREYHARLESLKGRQIPIVLDEWNYWYGPDLYGQIGVRYYLRDALGIAAGLHALIRNSDLFVMANYAQTVNVIGAVKTSKTDAALETTGLSLMLYRRHFGVIPVEVAGAPSPLDVAAAWTQDRKALTVGVVNPTKKTLRLKLSVDGAKLAGKGKRWVISGRDELAYNEPGKGPQVTIEESKIRVTENTLEVPPISVSLYGLAANR